MDVVDVDVEVQRVVGGGLTETVEDRDVLLSFPSAARAAPLLAARGATELRELLVGGMPRGVPWQRSRPAWLAIWRAWALIVRKQPLSHLQPGTPRTGECNHPAAAWYGPT